MQSGENYHFEDLERGLDKLREVLQRELGAELLGLIGGSFSGEPDGNTGQSADE